MSAGVLLLLLVLTPLGLAAVPLIAARRSGTFFVADVGTVLVPPLAYIASLAVFNEPARTTFAGLYVVLVLWLCVAAVHVRVFLLPRIDLDARVAAIGTLLVATGAAALLGAEVAPLYE